MPEPHRFAQTVNACPLRLVLADEFTRCSTALAYAEGDRLSGCLDLVRAPSEQVWVEWSEAPRLEALSAMLETAIAPAVAGGRCGVLISTDASGRAGTIRSFWSTPGDGAHCAALIADFDLNLRIRCWNSVVDIFKGEPAGVTVSEEPAFDALLSHIRFRFDPAWSDYYRAENLSSEQQAAVLCTALGSTAFIVPMLFAAFLLLAADGGARQQAVNWDRLNRIRRKSGQRELLEHLQVFTGARAQPDRGRTAVGENTSLDPGPHHLRDHLSRHGQEIFWRSPQPLGSAPPGVTRSRTVKLSFP